MKQISPRSKLTDAIFVLLTISFPDMAATGPYNYSYIFKYIIIGEPNNSYLILRNILLCHQHIQLMNLINQDHSLEG